MSTFLRLAGRMLEERFVLAWSIVFAIVSALGLGAGLLAVVPTLDMILARNGARSLPELVHAHNAKVALAGGVSIPETLISWLPSEPFQGILLIMGSLLVLTFVGATANFLHMHLSGAVAARTIGRIRDEVFEHAIQLPLTEVVVRGPSEFVARVVRDAAELQRGFLALTSKAIAQLTKGGVALAVAIVVEPRLTLIAVPTALIVGVALRKLGKRVRRGTRGSLAAQEGLVRVATETMQGLRSVKANTGESTMAARFAALNDRVVHHELRVRTARALSSPLLEMLAMVILIGLAVLAARFILAGVIEPERFMAALIALGVAGGAFRPLAGLVTEVQAAAAPARRLADILDTPVETPADEATRPRLARHERSIGFEAVGVQYPNATLAALQDVSLTVEHGQRVALVGPNGSGKTTLISLLPRLVEPASGVITIDGVDIRTVSLASLRGQIGLVAQETMLFRGTIAENIAFGEASATPARIQDAARRAHADEFIQAIPGGYDADLAEQGSSLSGGQRQRLAIARLILRDPAIVILDEATSQIDATSEMHINQALGEFAERRTVFIVAHRLSTVQDVDRIIVLDQGRLVAEGRHDELLTTSPLYRQLAETQLVRTATPSA